jgi:hypothetical protein
MEMLRGPPASASASLEATTWPQVEKTTCLPDINLMTTTDPTVSIDELTAHWSLGENKKGIVTVD